MRWVSPTKAGGGDSKAVVLKSKLNWVGLFGLVLFAFSLFTHMLLARYTYGFAVSDFKSAIIIFSWRPVFRKCGDSLHGLMDTSSACCVTWMNGTSGSIPEFEAFVSKSPEKHYFWDGYHLTEIMYREIATLCFNCSSICIPKNIQELVLQA